MLSSFDAVVHYYYEQCDTGPYILAVFAVGCTLVVVVLTLPHRYDVSTFLSRASNFASFFCGW